MSRNAELFERACRSIPGGVNSPVRAFKSVDGEPLFIKRSFGSKLWDADNNEYIDYVGSWGPAIVGHAHPDVVKTICEVAANGISFGAPTELETILAKAVIDFPHGEITNTAFAANFLFFAIQRPDSNQGDILWNHLGRKST